VPNKPMVPTAPTANSLDPMRRHMGKPLGRERRAKSGASTLAGCCVNRIGRA
jgi:hypothetical protein